MKNLFVYEKIRVQKNYSIPKISAEATEKTGKWPPKMNVIIITQREKQAGYDEKDLIIKSAAILIKKKFLVY